MHFVALQGVESLGLYMVNLDMIEEAEKRKLENQKDSWRQTQEAPDEHDEHYEVMGHTK